MYLVKIDSFVKSKDQEQGYMIKNLLDKFSTALEAVRVGDQGKGFAVVALAPEIKRTAQLVEQIAMASNEQCRGAVQVNNAILELNTISQQNSVISEKLSASSKELVNQSNRLKTTINYFKL